MAEFLTALFVAGVAGIGLAALSLVISEVITGRRQRAELLKRERATQVVRRLRALSERAPKPAVRLRNDG